MITIQPLKYTVTKHAVVDGVLQGSNIGVDYVVNGDTYNIPANATRNGCVFGGWYTTSALSTKYSATAINANTDIYARFTTLNNDTYIYYVTSISDGSQDTPDYIYAWGDLGEQFGSFPGVRVTSAPGVTVVSGVLNFQGSYKKIYKIPMSSTITGHFKFSYDGGGTGKESANLLFSAGSAYWYTNEANYHNDDAGKALDLLVAAEAKRNAVSNYGEHNQNWSVCGISASDAATLWNQYYALTASQKGYVDSTTAYTWKDASSNNTDTNQKNWTYAEIMLQLKDIAIKGGQTVSGGSNISNPLALNENSTAIIIVVVSTLSLVALGGFFFIKRRKESK